MEIKRVAEEIFSFQLFPEDFCARIIESSRRGAWRQATIYRDGKERLVPGARLCEEMRSRDFALLRRCFDERFASVVVPLVKICWEVRVKRWMSWFIRYKIGGFTGRHVDYYPGCAARNRPRIISLTCYLNDDFSGGRTVFHRQNCAVAPKRGQAIIFPSGFTHPHCSEPVVTGTKHVFVVRLS